MGWEMIYCKQADVVAGRLRGTLLLDIIHFSNGKSPRQPERVFSLNFSVALNSALSVPRWVGGQSFLACELVCNESATVLVWAVWTFTSLKFVVLVCLSNTRKGSRLKSASEHTPKLKSLDSVLQLFFTVPPKVGLRNTVWRIQKPELTRSEKYTLEVDFLCFSCVSRNWSAKEGKEDNDSDSDRTMHGQRRCTPTHNFNAEVKVYFCSTAILNVSLNCELTQLWRWSLITPQIWFGLKGSHCRRKVF